MVSLGINHMNNLKKEDLCNRWVSIIRDKAIQYEAEQRKNGEGDGR